MTKSNSSKIGLLDNACHSLERGYEMFNKGRKNKDALALKEAIIWIHHGIELSIKQLLVQSNEYLIFENVDEAIRKLAHLRRQPNMGNAQVLDLFDSGEGIYTVGFGKLVDRAAIMLNIPELNQGAQLREKIDDLTSYRNKTVHFTIEVKVDEVVSLLAGLAEPFLILLEREVKNKDFIKQCIPTIKKHAKPVSNAHLQRYQEIEKRIRTLLGKFNEQTVPGKLFSAYDEVILPHFKSIEKQQRKRGTQADLIARSETIDWQVEIKIGTSWTKAFYQIGFQEKYYSMRGKIQPWVILIGPEKDFALGLPAYISWEEDITELEKFVK